MRYDYLGEHQVKNIAKPVRVYRARIESGEPSEAKVKANGEGKAEVRKAIKFEPDDLFTHLGLAHTYVKLDRDKEAQAEAAEVLRIHPKFSLEYFAKTFPFKDQSVVDDFIACLRKAGLE